MISCIRVVHLIFLVSIAAYATPSDQAPYGENPSISPEIRAVIAEVQSDYMLCMVPKLPEYDDSVRDVAAVAAALRESCSGEAADGVEKLRPLTQ